MDRYYLTTFGLAVNSSNMLADFCIGPFLRGIVAVYVLFSVISHFRDGF